MRHRAGPRHVTEALPGIIELIQSGMRRSMTIDAIGQAADWKARLRAIDAYYLAVDSDIRASARDEWAYDVYEVDWSRYFTPIEAWLWSDIREVGLVMYPQFPMRRRGEPTFFADFANPIAKVCIECDGKDFHDAEQDARRDAILESRGWTVYRFTGRTCRIDTNENGQPSPAISLLRRIRANHFDVTF